MNSLHENYSAKLKRVFIEIHNYSFSHGSAENGKPNNRFIGRERLLERFKSILTKSDRKSGIYLVTGYRGMGKTSFVNKAIEEVYYPDIKIKAVLNWAIYLLLSYLLSVFLIFLFYIYKHSIIDSIKYISILNIILFTLSISSYIYLNKTIQGLITRILNNDEAGTKLKHKKYFEKFILIEFITSVLFIIIYIYSILYNIQLNNGLTTFVLYLKIIFKSYIIFYVTICILNYIYWLIKYYNVKSRRKAKKYKTLLYYIIDPIRRFINYSSTVVIHLNLGYSNLKEINILKLIAKNLSVSFELQRRKFTLNKLIRLAVLAIIICFASVFYNLNPTKRFNSLLKNSMGMTLYFPSQHDYFVQNDSITLAYVVETMKLKRKLSSENYFVYTQAVSGIFDNQSLEVALTYLTNLDKYLMYYLNIDSLMKLPYQNFKNTLILKNDYYFNLYNIYSVLKSQPIEKINKPDSLIKISTNELANLLMHFEDNPNALVEKEPVSLESLFKLKKVSDLYSQYSSFKQIKKNVLTITNHLDYFVSQAYYYFRQIIPISPLIAKSKILILPKNIDYLYFIYIVLFVYIFKLIQRIFNYNKPSLKSVKNKLNFINELINSNITFEKSTEVNLISTPFLFNRKKNQNYPQADEREIEKYLIEIINDINRLPVNSYRSEFILIFDELDKIESNYQKDNNNSNAILFSPEASRSRLHAVISLLSNLKYFLSTAQSKFIFIAGREMFDASLADVSDRNFKIGSIFHDVFYVDSFYSDTAEYDFEDMTSRTEQYVCQFLQPSFDKYSSLIKYNEFLLNIPEFNEYDPAHKNAFEKIIAKQKREKIIYLLQQFIVYLNHQSAGAPSKINAYFENYIINSDMFQSNWTEYSILVGNKNSDNLFLFFDYYSQYELGLVNYLITPFNYSINKLISNYADKLIVSASFLHNHLFKFHRNAFSWRDLESTPEIVDVNKNPELRDFLSRLIEFMSNTHMQEIIYGIYDFKFTKTISQELLFLSHISDEASANFNFTLDESLIVKQYYLEQLQKLKNNTDEEKDVSKYVFSIASVNLTMADLCFYDGDYGEAILYYLQAIQQIRSKKIEDLTITQLVLLTRNMLKLGYSLERRKTYESAQLTYCEITDIILNKVKSIIEENKSIEFLKTVIINTNYLYQPFLAKLYLIEKSSLDGVTDSDLNNIYNEFENIKCIFSKIDEKIEHFSEYRDKYLVQAKFWNKIGNLFYYKNITNSSHTICPFSNQISNPYRTCIACKKYLDSLNLIFIKHSIQVKIETNIEQYQFYFQSLKELVKSHDTKVFSVLEYKIIAVLVSNYANICLNCTTSDSLSLEFINELNQWVLGNKKLNDIEKVNNKVEMMLFSNCVSAYFYEIAHEFSSAANKLKNILNFFNVYISFSFSQASHIKNEIVSITSSVSNMAIKLIYASYEFIHIYEINKYKKVLNNQNSNLNDISLRRISINSDLDEINILNEMINITLYPERVVQDEIFSVYCYVSPHNMITKMYNRILSLKLRSTINRLLLIKKLGLSEEPKNYASIFKTVIDKIDTKITFSGKEYSYIEFLEYLIADSIFCNFEIIKICNTFDRSFSLNFSLLGESHFNLWIWAEYLNGYKLLNKVLEMISSKYLASNIILFIKKCTKEIPINDDIIKRYIQTLSNSKHIKYFSPTTISNSIEQLIEPHNLQYITPIYQCEKAISAFKDTINTHKQGNTYKNLIDNMYYLNDDFNDELYHFSVALERFKINTQIIKKQIDQLTIRNKDSRIFKQNKYVEEII